LNEHIPELIGLADKELVEYWRKEVHRLIDEMEGWGGRLSKNDDVHSVPHLVAAGQIYDEIPNLFDEQKGVHDWASFVDQ